MPPCGFRLAVRDYVYDAIVGTAYGILGMVNGIGDFASSLIVGLLRTSVGASWALLMQQSWDLSEPSLCCVFLMAPISRLRIQRESSEHDGY